MELFEFAYKNFVRSFLWKLQPDTSHHIGQKFYKDFECLFWLLQHKLYVDDPRLRTEIFGKQLSDPLILAAGWDKNGDITKSMVYTGFRNIILGSVRPHFYAGNKKPWFDRNVESMEFYNSIGLSSMGARYVAEKLGELWPKFKERVTIIANYVGNSIEQILEVDRYLNNLYHMREINASCPNTADGKFFEQNPERLKKVLVSLNDQKKIPTFVKISPDYVPNKKEELLRLIKICKDTNTGIDSGNTRIVYNTKLKRNAGLSGPKLFESTKKQVRFIYSKTEGEIPLIGTGGVETGGQEYELIGYGCNAVGILTSLITRGPTSPRNVNLELLGILNRSRYHSVEELNGKLI